MPEITLKYKNKRTLEALQDFAKYFNFEILSTGKVNTLKKEKLISINGITIIAADRLVETTELTQIFTGKISIPHN